ncbi:MAG: DNA methyltransferase [Eubacteriales bacterium]|nr:DNA methyltransferase [Eubacteriales bacterium]MDD3199214.1 DNA methyltransferase [Eubacteriales bacterium]MDD4629131.1 DNA methyltransferase [Eubacteriales bacterium]
MYLQPKGFALETTTMWSFPDRGNWATHSGIYRGNWSPYIPRNLIIRYSQPNDWVLDQFLGSGTTLIEAKLLSRNAIGTDVNSSALLSARKNIDFECNHQPDIIIKKCDARNLDFIRFESIDLVCTHPPYADIIKYSREIKDDLSRMKYPFFLNEMQPVAKEAYRVLKKGKYCAIMIGDIRSRGNIVPLGFKVMECFQKEGFKIKEIVIKKQHNCRSESYWTNLSYEFLLIAHEYIFIFEK